MQFDTSTTLIAILCIVAVLGVQSLFFWLREPRQSPWLAWFGAAYLLGAASIELELLPLGEDSFIQHGLGGALRIACFAALWQSMRRFNGRAADALTPGLMVSVWLGLSSIAGFRDNAALSAALGSLLVAVLSALSARELWRERRDALPSQGPMLVLCASCAALWLVHIPFAGVAPFPIGSRPVDPTWLAASGLVACFMASFGAMLMLSLTRERREAEQRRVALIDPLTELLNRRAFLDAARHRERRRKEMSGDIAVLVLDLDHFKQINDRYGHDTGDQVLQHFASVARSCTRPADLLHRMGGEEFCFVLPGVAGREAVLIAERIRTRFAETPAFIDGNFITATVSIGAAVTETDDFDLEALLAAADKAVYAAKAAGRNRTVMAEAPILLPAQRAVA